MTRYLVFETLSGDRYPVDSASIQSLSFIDADLYLPCHVLVLYTEGDCDVLSPYVTL